MKRKHLPVTLSKLAENQSEREMIDGKKTEMGKKGERQKGQEVHKGEKKERKGKERGGRGRIILLF